MTEQNDKCCPEFKREKWDEKTHSWDKKPFILESIPTFFHIPFPPMIGKKVAKMCRLMEASGRAEKDKEEVLLLFRDPGAFKSEIYLSVTGPVKDAHNAEISGTFISKVFSGPYNAVPSFIRQMNEYLASRGNKAKDYYIHYAYCQKCAEKHGNAMILFALVENAG
jgi:hypothetical protein